MEISVKIKLKDGSIRMPEYKTAGAAGMDLEAAEDGVVQAGERAQIPTGLFMEIPEGFEGQIRPRSGLAIKYGVTMLNSPGTIDSDYRGEICLILYNSSQEAFRYAKGDRLAQLVLAPVIRGIFEEVEVLPDTVRGEGGFGSTGK